MCIKEKIKVIKKTKNDKIFKKLLVEVLEEVADGLVTLYGTSEKKEEVTEPLPVIIELGEVIEEEVEVKKKSTVKQKKETK